MEDLVHLEEDGLNHIMTDELEVGLPNEVCDVLLAPGEEIVHADHLRAQPSTHIDHHN